MVGTQMIDMAGNKDAREWFSNALHVATTKVREFILKEEKLVIILKDTKADFATASKIWKKNRRN